MKKLRLSALELGAKEVLSRDQLKRVLGGFSGCSVSVTCSGGGTKSCSCSSGTCVTGDGVVSCTCDLTSGSEGGSGTQVSVTLNCPSGSGGSGN